MLLYGHDDFLRHDTGAHPECAARLQAIERRLRTSGLVEMCRKPDWAAADDRRLEGVHALEYVHQVERFADEGGGMAEADTVVSPHSVQAARLAAGAVCDAVTRVVEGQGPGSDHQALCLVRPPGHHALPASAMGFCLFNNVAVGARWAVQHLGLDRVMIVDWDVHHGNGTQDMFYDDGQIGFLSMHRFPFYPGSGAESETGTGDGLGATLNVPIRFGETRRVILEKFTRGVEDLAARIKPQLVLVSAGFDAHRLDPIGSLGLESDDFHDFTEVVVQVAEQYAEGKLVSVLEGGYNVEALAESVEIHLRSLLHAEGKAVWT